MEISQRNILESINYGCGIHHPGYLGYLMYNILMACAIRTIYTSKCVQINPQQQSETSKLYSICNTCAMQKAVGYIDTTWYSPKVKHLLDAILQRYNNLNNFFLSI